MLNIGTQKPQEKPFAINLAIRNANGEVTRYKYYEADSGDELYDIWEKHTAKPNNKRKNTNSI